MIKINQNLKDHLLSAASGLIATVATAYAAIISHIPALAPGAITSVGIISAASVVADKTKKFRPISALACFGISLYAAFAAVSAVEGKEFFTAPVKEPAPLTQHFGHASDGIQKETRIANKDNSIIHTFVCSKKGGACPD